VTTQVTAADKTHGVDQLLANVPSGETPDLSGAFPRLEEARLRELEAWGERRPTSRGDVLIAEGEPEDTFFVLLSGRVAAVEALGTPAQRVARLHGPGRFLGELGVLTAQPAFLSDVVVDPGEVLALPADRLRAVAAAAVTLDGGLPATLRLRPGHAQTVDLTAAAPGSGRLLVRAGGRLLASVPWLLRPATVAPVALGPLGPDRGEPELAALLRTPRRRADRTHHEAGQR
jgi:hypothetical protein